MPISVEISAAVQPQVSATDMRTAAARHAADARASTAKPAPQEAPPPPPPPPHPIGMNPPNLGNNLDAWA